MTGFNEGFMGLNVYCLQGSGFTEEAVQRREFEVVYSCVCRNPEPYTLIPLNEPVFQNPLVPFKGA